MAEESSFQPSLSSIISPALSNILYLSSSCDGFLNVRKDALSVPTVELRDQPFVSTDAYISSAPRIRERSSKAEEMILHSSRKHSRVFNGVAGNSFLMTLNDI